LSELPDRQEPLWVNGHSSHNGKNDRVPLRHTGRIRDSLKLIRVSPLVLRVHMGYREREIRAHFRHGGTDYALRVTDPTYVGGYLAQPDGLYLVNHAFLTVSLGEAFHGYVYKLVAAVIERTDVN
jgi:hypothetical protein